MEDIYSNYSSDKENVIGHIIDCSPVLPTKKVNNSQSPLALLLRQDNVLDSPEIGKTHGLSGVEKTVSNKDNPRFLSTPLRLEQQPLSTNYWEDIRKLDEEEGWVERTQVVTKEDHFLYFKIAKEVVNSIIENLPINSMENTEGTTKPLGSEEEENAGNDTIVCGEKKEDQATEFVTLDDLQPAADQALEKSILEDNDFIHSCSKLDETVKEILEDEEPISPMKFDDIPTDEIDGDKTICEDVVCEDVVCEDVVCEDVVCEDVVCEDVGVDIKLFDPRSEITQVTAVETEKNELETFDVKVSEDPLEPIEDGNFGFGDDPFRLEAGDQDGFHEDSFRPATEAFTMELDYLENRAQSEDTEHMNDLQRQSLYVKFDPLVEAKQQNQALTALSRFNPADMIFSGPISSCDLLVMDTPPRQPAKSRVPYMVPQATTDELKPREAIALVDQLFEFSPEKRNPSNDQTVVEDSPKYNENETIDDSSLVQPLLYSKSDLDKTVAGERDRLTSQWKEESALTELEIKELTTKCEKVVLENEKAFHEIEEMKTVMSEYEQTMAQMIEDREKLKCDHGKSNSAIVQERDQLQHDLHNTEKSFAHLHTRFEKLKTIVDGYRKNEETLKKAVKSLQENKKISEGNYQSLKKQAEEKLHEANTEVSRLQTTNKNETSVLQTALKKERSKISSLQQSLDQKITENNELTAICDELINSKVGPLQ